MASTAPQLEQDSSTLTKLPPEIRNRIYEELVVAEGPVQITLHHTFKIEAGKVRIGRKYVRESEKEYFVRSQLDNGRQARLGGETPFLGPNGASVLRTTKWIYEEMIAMLYGSNVLVFDSYPSLLTFKNQVGRCWPLLKDVVFRSHARVMRSPCRLFLDHPHLVHLSISILPSAPTISNRYHSPYYELFWFVVPGRVFAPKTAEDRRRRFSVITFDGALLSAAHLAIRLRTREATMASGPAGGSVIHPRIEHRFVECGLLEPADGG